MANKISSYLLILFLLAALGGYAFAFTEIRSKQAREADLERELVIEYKKEREFRALKSLVEDTSPVRKALDDLFIAKDGIAAFIESVEALGSLSGLSLEVGGISVEAAPVESDKREQLSLSLQTKGSWANTMKFLSLIENLPFVASLSAVDIKTADDIEADPKTKSRSPGIWKGRIDIKVLKSK